MSFYQGNVVGVVEDVALEVKPELRHSVLDTKTFTLKFKGRKTELYFILQEVNLCLGYI